MTITKIGGGGRDVVHPQCHLEAWFGETSIGHCQTEQRFWRRVSPDTHQIQRFPGTDHTLQIWMAENQGTQPL